MKRHDLDVISLVSGLLFAVLGVIFALNALGTFDFDVRVVPATVLIVLGIAGISASIVKATRAVEERDAGSEPERVSASASAPVAPGADE